MAVQCAAVLPLLLLLAAAAAPAAPRAQTLAALELDAEFLCTHRTLVPLVLLSGGEAALQVPAGCPAAGARWSLQGACAKSACTLTVREAGRVLADVEGARPRKGRPLPLALTPRPGLAPATLQALQLLQLSATGETQLKVDPRVELQRPLRVAFRGSSFTYKHPLAPGARTRLAPRQTAEGVELDAQAERLDRERVRLRLWSPKGVLLLERTLRLGSESVPFPCERSEGWCAEAVQVGVELLPPQPLQP